MDWKELLLNDINEIKQEAKEHRAESQVHNKEVDLRLSAIEKDLSYHIKRTDILEKEVKPIKQHVVGINYIVSSLLLLGSIAAGLSKIIGLW
jgi:hypothetical protein